jgi:hypothetical protein
VSAALDDVANLLDAYRERCAKPAGLRSIATVRRSQITVLRNNLGHLPLRALEDPDEINRFKTDSEWAEDVEVASIHRVLERLRAAMNWGIAQTPPPRLTDRQDQREHHVRQHGLPQQRSALFA